MVVSNARSILPLGDNICSQISSTSVKLTDILSSRGHTSARLVQNRSVSVSSGFNSENLVTNFSVNFSRVSSKLPQHYVQTFSTMFLEGRIYFCGPDGVASGGEYPPRRDETAYILRTTGA